MEPDYTCVLLDLDGTIADSAPGITSCLAAMFAELGLPVPPPAELLRYVGPPILEAFRDLAGFDEQQSDRALEVYRRHYLARGVLDSTIYPGMADAVRAIHASPLMLSLATSKPETPATLILDHFRLTEYFDVITGASDDEVRSAKADVVEEALRRLAALGADVSRPVMVGDREHDVAGAAARGVPTIFVEWGYGAPTEQVGAVAVATDAGDLVRRLLGDGLDAAA